MRDHRIRWSFPLLMTIGTQSFNEVKTVGLIYSKLKTFIRDTGGL